MIGLLLLSVVVVALMRWLNPPTTSFMIQKWVSSAAEDAHLRYQWTPYEAIAPGLALAVVAAEDQKFPDHSGFDWDSMRSALEHNRAGGRKRGGSTISQQVAKNLFLWPGRSYLRKGLEAYLAWLMELFWPKRRILEIYLNVAEFGPLTFGASAASERYFDTLPKNLSREQAALLAAVLPSPERFRVEAPSAYVRQRQRWILRQMRALGGTAFLKNI